MNQPEKKDNADGRLSFPALVLGELLRSVYNDYRLDNYDEDRFGPRQSSRKQSLFNAASRLVADDRLFLIPRDLEESASEAARRFQSMGEISFLHDLLADDYSKKMLVSLMAYYILGSQRVKLPSNNSEYWKKREIAQRLKSAETIPSKFLDWPLHRFNLNSIGWPVELFFTANGILKTYLLKQYQYNQRPLPIKVQPGDTVIDAGGCWGDTALYFAHLAGSNGHVHTFEFLQSNLDILNRNLKLNPSLSPRITLVPNPVFSKPSRQLFVEENGPATRISETPSSPNATPVTTVALDDYAAAANVGKIGFIKMDIEGAELSALEGAKQILQRDRPKLAIALYHDLADFVRIPKFLASLNLNYRFYLDHFTIHKEETILFADPV